MWNLRQIISQNRKRIGFLIGAGAPAGLSLIGGEPFIPAIKELTAKVINGLPNLYGPAVEGICADLGGEDPNIELILSRVRALSSVLGEFKVYDFNGEGFKDIGKLICEGIGELVSKPLPPGENAYTQFVSWVVGASRTNPVEIFTTNYDLLFETAFENSRNAYYDGFVGGRAPFFDAASVAENDLPSRWTRLWKLHGSLGWELGEDGEVTRTAKSSSPYCVFPEHLKYEQTQKAPYSALFDRLRAFLSEKDTLLVCCGFSFADSHITGRIGECLSSNPSASVFAFQYKNLDEENFAHELAMSRPNMSVYARDRAVINCIAAQWKTGDPPIKNWDATQGTFWHKTKQEFLLGDFAALAPFLASARTEQRNSPSPTPDPDMAQAVEA
jgi:hypothetical protein